MHRKQASRAVHFKKVLLGLSLNKRSRQVVDIFSPEGSSVNDCTDQVLCSKTYVSVQDAMFKISKLGESALMAKIDINDAYRITLFCPEYLEWWLDSTLNLVQNTGIIPVHLADRHILGI